MKYYKFKRGFYLTKAPYIIPKNSLFTANEIQRFRLHHLIEFTEEIELNPSKDIYFFYYDFRFQKKGER